MIIWITSPGYRASTSFFFSENTAVIMPLVSSTNDIFPAPIPEVGYVFAHPLALYNALIGYLYFKLRDVPLILHSLEDFVSSPLEFGVEGNAIVLHLLGVVLALALALRDQLDS